MAKDKTKKKNAPVHVIYNQKEFLAPDSLTSSAMIHSKIKPCGEVQVRISDCNNTIKLWNNLNCKDEAKMMLTKLDTIIVHLDNFRAEIISRNQGLN